MKNVVRYIVTGILALFVLWGTSCSHDTENFSLSDRGTALSIGFRLPIRSLAEKAQRRSRSVSF